MGLHASAVPFPAPAGSKGVLSERSPTPTPPLSDDEIWQNWRDACLADGGETTVPGHLVNELRAILRREGANYAIRNERNGEGGNVHNQVTVPNSGRTLVFNMETEKPITIQR